MIPETVVFVFNLLMCKKKDWRILKLYKRSVSKVDKDTDLVKFIKT